MGRGCYLRNIVLVTCILQFTCGQVLSDELTDKAVYRFVVTSECVEPVKNMIERTLNDEFGISYTIETLDNIGPPFGDIENIVTLIGKKGKESFLRRRAVAAVIQCLPINQAVIPMDGNLWPGALEKVLKKLEEEGQSPLRMEYTDRKITVFYRRGFQEIR